MADSGEPSGWTVGELAAAHDRSSFCCGHESLDQFLKLYATQNQKSGISRTFVATRPSQHVVRGYYSLAAGSVQFDTLPDELRKRLPKYRVPVAHLGRLAVDRTCQGQGLGSYLLMDAFARILRVDHAIGMHAISVSAIDAAARNFYLKYGFTALRDDPTHLFIPLKLIRKLNLE